MDRLTVPDVRVDEYTTRRTFIDVEAVREHAMEFYWRLKAYEDTHMMPSDVTSMRMDMAILAALFNGIDVDRMRELVAAERDGRVVVPPCKVGDTVYYRCGKRITDFEIVGFSVDKKGASIIYAEHHADENSTAYSCVFDVKKIGKTVFFTREEAERALRKEKVTE